MQYLFIKHIISSILTNFQCPECRTQATESSLDINKISDKGLDISFMCPNCSTRAIMKAEIGQLSGNFLWTDAGKDFIKNSIINKKLILPNSQKNPQNGISSDEIHKIEDILSKNPTINDLINGE